MAHTKKSARKNAYPCSLSSSSPSSESIQRSPSPPPRPIPPHISFDTSFSDYLSSSPENNLNLPINPNPLSIILPPLYTCPPPNLAQVLPHLRKPTIPKRRSMRVQHGIGTSKSSPEKPFYFIISDYETDDSSDTPLRTKKAQTKPITPSKSSFFFEPSQSTPANQKRRLINEIFSSLPKPSQPTTQSKKTTKHSMKTKTTMTITQFLARNKLNNPQRKKMFAPKQNLKLTKPASPEHSPFLQCSPTPNPEHSPVRIPSRSPQKERSPHQECSSAKPFSPSHSPKHSSPVHTPSPSSKSKHSPTSECSSSSTFESSKPSPLTKKIQTKHFLSFHQKTPKISKTNGLNALLESGEFLYLINLINGNVVQHHTDALGWTSFLKTSKHYYLDVVRAFYYNATTFPDKSLIISTIKVIKIRLTPAILASILQLPTEGPSVFGNKWYSTLNLKETKVLSDLFQECSTRYLSTYLKPLLKVFNNMSQHTLLPHCGSHEYVSANDALIIYHLLNCKRLNLPRVIIQHMIYAATKDYKKNTIPYGMILTKIFRHFGIPLSTEKSLIKISKFSTNNLSHMRKTFSEQHYNSMSTSTRSGDYSFENMAHRTTRSQAGNSTSPLHLIPLQVPNPGKSSSSEGSSPSLAS
uniref:Uncharacterized protein LOC101492141 n=1 Tax=Cicer arietinum TaxID=3827 RepID=A0A1S2YWN3_CICAR|nr:uncharacterized protein LOC101492141 [Cicer arietinum]